MPYMCICVYASKTITVKPFGPILTQPAIAIMDRRVGITRCRGARRVHYTPAAYACVYTDVRVNPCVRVCRARTYARNRRSCAFTRYACMREYAPFAIPARASYGNVFGASVRALELSISARLDSAHRRRRSRRRKARSRCFPCVDESDEEDTGRERGRPLKFI